MGLILPDGLFGDTDSDDRNKKRKIKAHGEYSFLSFDDDDVILDDCTKANDEDFSFEDMCANVKDDDFSFENLLAIAEAERVANSNTATNNTATTSYSSPERHFIYESTWKSPKEKRLEELARHGISPGRPNKTQQRKLVLFERELRSRGYSKKEIDKVIKDTIDYITS